MSVNDRSVALIKTITKDDGETTFEESATVLNYGDPDDPPLAKSKMIAATAISFHWDPGDKVFDIYPAPRRRLIIPLEGQLEVIVSTGESRKFAVGDVVEIGDVSGKGHICRSVDGRPYRSALINLDDNLVAARTKPIVGPIASNDVSYLRTYDGPEGRSVTEAGHLPYRHGDKVGGLVTDEIAITGFQFVLAPPDLDYAWHRAPQRQFVIPITGGMEIENGQGKRHKVLPGEIYVGEDVDGHGHITRALKGRERLSIFAHLSDRLE
ncbi:MAG: hypothetical protein ACR2PG_16595 [Hyphomicrobiaceae bacterium]